MSQKTYEPFPRPVDLDLSTLSKDDLQRLKDAIVAHASRTVDPYGLGFDPLLMATDDDPFQTHDDISMRDWLDAVARIINVVSKGATLVGLGIVTAGGAIAGSNILTANRDSSLGLGLLGIAGVFGVWFAASAGLSAIRRS